MRRDYYRKMMASPSQICSLLQTNLHHSETATAQARKWLEVNQTAIALIQEPWIRGGNICGLRNLGGKLIVHTSSDKPRACIYISRNIHAQPLTNFCSRDVCAVKLHRSQDTSLPEMVVASVYMPEGEDPPPHHMAQLVAYCEASGLQLIVATDSNAHHNLWGMKTNNERGKLLVEYLSTTNLNIMNIGAEPTFVNRRSRTIIDLTLATEEASKNISNWHVSQEASCSDHRWIRYDIQVNTVVAIPRRNPRRTDRSRYSKQLEQLLAQQDKPVRLLGPEAIEKQVGILRETITECYHHACPLSTPPAGNDCKTSWWGPELERLRARVRHCLNRAMNTCDDRDWDDYKKAKSRYKKRLRYRSSNSWRNFCDNIETSAQANRVRKVLSQQPNQTLGSLRKTDNTLTNSPEETECTLIQTHFPGCHLEGSIAWHDVTINPEEEHWGHALEVISPQKLRWAINSFESYKSPGLDGVFPALLKWGGEHLIQILTNIMVACLAHRYIPKQWREVKVIFIPKPGKSDYSDPKSYRPISLTSFLLKTLERLCDRDLRENALRNIPMHQNQHAYSSGKSTESALHRVVSTIEEAIQNKSMCLGVFIDIEGAFDKTNFTSIISALQRHKVNATLIGWIGNMLSQRAIKLTTADSTYALVAKGCPQGGVLSPLLWNMVANDLIATLNSQHFLTVGYADDIAILTSGNDVSTVCDVTRTALRIVEHWCTSNELSVNPKKTEMVLFTHKRKLSNHRLPSLFGTELQFTTEVKYLGVILDSKLNWSSHLNSKIDKATIMFWQCRRMIGKTWGLTPKTTLWLYTSVIRPVISYGAIVWWPRTKLSTVAAKLQRLQRLACMAATGCMRTTPTAALEALLDLPPLHLFIKQEAAATAVRLQRMNLWRNTRVPHTEILEEWIGKEPLIEAVTDWIPKKYIFDKKYKIQLHEEPLDTPKPRELRIYTDGSKTKSGTGSGAFSEDLHMVISTSLGNHNTVFQAECMGIITAATAIANRKVKEYPIRILSDSKSVLQALQSHTITSGLIYECHLALSKVCQQNSITLQWIKGHSGSRGNDAADSLARMGSEGKAIGPEPILPLPFGWLRSALRQHTKVTHQLLWSSLSTCRQARQALPTINPGLSRKLHKLKRPQLRLLVGAITGHALFNKHLYNLDVTDSPLCRACMEAEETAAHVLLDCSGVATYRAVHLGSPRSLQEVVGNIKGLLGFLQELGWQE